MMVLNVDIYESFESSIKKTLRIINEKFFMQKKSNKKYMRLIYD